NTKRTYLYGGVIHCGYCRHRLGSGFQPARHQGLGTKYYHGLSKREISVGRCAHCPQVAETRLHPLWDAIKSAVIDPEYLRAKVAEYHSRDKTNIRARLAELEQQISTVDLQRKKMLSVYVQDDRLDENEYLRLVHGIDRELQRLREEKLDIERRLLNEGE